MKTKEQVKAELLEALRNVVELIDDTFQVEYGDDISQGDQELSNLLYDAQHHVNELAEYINGIQHQAEIARVLSILND